MLKLLDSEWKFYEMTDASAPGAIEELYRIQKAVFALRRAGAKVERHEFMEEPSVFLTDEVASKALEEGDEAFPLLVIGGRRMKSGTYPTSEEFATWSGLAVDAFPSEFSEDEISAWKELIELSSSHSCSDCSGCAGGCSSGCGSEEDLEID